jgi:hypothetical protein
MKSPRRLIAVVALLPLWGCAFDVVHVHQVPATFLRNEAPGDTEYTLSSDLTVYIGTGFPTHLKHGTHWHYLGKTEYGDVLSTTDQIVTVEASNIHEAQAVISGQKLTGFYLPVEKKFVPVKQPPVFETSPTLPNPQ